IYNKAYVFGNDAGRVGSLSHGSNAVEAANSGFSTAKHVIQPSGGVELQLRVAKYAILQSMQPQTAFYCWTHGAGGNYFGDSYAGPPPPDGDHYIVYNDIITALEGRDLSLPPYNFVFIDACET